jgi:ABC-type dipeptide/oligopeptide/nickel transport system permease component
VIGYYAAVRYLCRRLGQGLLVLFAVSALSFALAETAPGSLVDELRLNPRISPATIEAMRDRSGLVAQNLPIIPLASPHVLVGATGGLGNFRPTVFDHHALWNADELFWRRGPPGARR